MNVKINYFLQLISVEHLIRLPGLIKNRGLRWVFNRISYNLEYFTLKNEPKNNNATKELESKYPGITIPVAINNLINLKYKFVDYPYQFEKNSEKRINFIFPQLDPLIMFGGYSSYINLMVKLDSLGYKTRAIISEDNNKFSRAALLNKYNSGPLRDLFSKIEIINLTSGKESLSISEEDEFFSYSTWTSYTADYFSKLINKKFYFFIQEDESIFHCNDSLQVLVNNAYDLDHFAIFNSEFLRKFFRDNKKGVYRDGVFGGNENSCSFEHALTKTKVPTIEELEHRKTKRVLIYLRPEEHAKRNLFEIAVLALQEAEKNGAFDKGNWEFIGVGTLGPTYEIPLSSKYKIKIISKMPASDYSKALTEFDLGLSLMNAPHPSLLPFEMASSGILTVTNVYSNRSAEDLINLSKNIFPAEMDIKSISDAIISASKKLNDHQYRIENSCINWSNDWAKSFNEEFMTNLTGHWK